MSTVPPLHREILVDATPDNAFAVFTERIGRWWPIAELSVHGEGGTVGFVDGRIVESGPDGSESVWGTVLDWRPPSSLAFTWHPGKSPESASRVEVTFTAADEAQTLVRLTHSGWEVFSDPAAAREEYGHGWPQVLAAYAEQAGAADREDDDPRRESATGPAG